MAANGFIELLRLSKRGNKSYAQGEQEVNRWSGIAFEMMGQYFVAPLGEVAEVIYPPKYTAVPNVQDWVRGLQIFGVGCYLFQIYPVLLLDKEANFPQLRKFCALAKMIIMLV